jgi:hypothetical protein
MTRRGRPRKNGVQSAEFFFREIEVVRLFTQARCAGEKYSGAVSESVQAFHKQCPETPLSCTEVKRIVARLQPQNRSFALTVKDSIPNEFHLDGQKYKYYLDIGFAPRPRYLRTNAKGAFKVLS